MKALVQCAKKSSPITLIEESFESSINVELTLFNEEPFGLIDIMTKLLNSMIEKAKCTLDVIGKIVGDGELWNVYKKFRDDVSEILKNDVKQCMQTKGLIEKLK